MACNGVEICVQDNGSFHREVTYTSDSSPVDITGASIKMEIRQAGPGSTLLLTLDNASNGGITIATDPTTGVYTITGTNANVQAILSAAGETAGKYDYEVILITSGGVQEPQFSGKLVITRGIAQV